MEAWGTLSGLVERLPVAPSSRHADLGTVRQEHNRTDAAGGTDSGQVPVASPRRRCGLRSVDGMRMPIGVIL